VSDETREHLESMLASVHKMVKTLRVITSRFGLEVGIATPLAILNDQQRTIPRAAIKVRHVDAGSRQAG